jgi:hypothetical protein
MVIQMGPITMGKHGSTVVQLGIFSPVQTALRVFNVRLGYVWLSTYAWQRNEEGESSKEAKHYIKSEFIQSMSRFIVARSGGGYSFSPYITVCHDRP